MTDEARKSHWEGVYGRKSPTEVSWFHPIQAAVSGRVFAMNKTWIFLGLLALTACNGLPVREGADDPAQATELRAWDRAGLEAQWRLDWLARRVPDGLGHEPGSTPWRDVEVELPATLVDPSVALSGSPTALLEEVVMHYGWTAGLGTGHWEQTMRLWMDGEDAAVGVLLRWGLKDDSVAGLDHRVFMSREGRAWRVERIEERYHCARGVTEDGLCL